MRQYKRWIVPAAVVLVLLAAVICLYAGGVLGERVVAPPGDNGENGAPGGDNGENGAGEPGDDNGGENGENGTELTLLQELERCQSDLERHYPQINQILDRYDEMEISDDEAAGELAELHDTLEGLADKLRELASDAGTGDGEKAADHFAKGAALTAEAVAAMIDHLETGDRAGLDLYREQVHAAYYHILQGEAALERLKLG